MKEKMCINFGAPIHSNICEYCGTEYELDEKQNCKQKGKQINDFTYELGVDGKKYLFYLGNVEVIKIVDLQRNFKNGKLEDKGNIKRKITLIQF